MLITENLAVRDEKAYLLSAVFVSLSQGTRPDNFNDDLWQAAEARAGVGGGGWKGVFGVVLAEVCPVVSIVWSPRSSCLLFIDAYSRCVLSRGHSMETHTVEVRR